MHIPDGLLPLALLVPLWIVSGLAVYVSVSRTNKRFDEKTVPYLGVLAAVIFAAQFVNFPVGPSSGHLVGATLVAVIVGPLPGLLIMSLVLLVQMLYGDGGVLAYGANLFNMGVFSCLLGWALAKGMFEMLKSRHGARRTLLISASVASYLTTVAAASVIGLEFLTLGELGFPFLVMVTAIHAVIGVGEALLTYAILSYFIKAAPNMISLLSGEELKELERARPAPLPNAART